MNQTLKQQLTSLLESSLNKLNLLPLIKEKLICVETSDERYGDYQFNIVMQLAKQLAQSPHHLANQIIQNLPVNKIIAKAEIAGPGFINTTIRDDILCQFIQFDLDRIDYQQSPLTVVIDYSSPNLAKQMHVGHLRSTIIGDSLVRINEFIGNKVIKRNHVGDWGTQFGMLIAYINQYKLNSNDDFLIEELENIYTEAKQQFDIDSNFATTARLAVVNLQQGNINSETYKTWQQIVSVSLKHCQIIYDLLQVKLTLDDVYGESYYNDLLPKMVTMLADKQLLKLSQGAYCVFCQLDDTTECHPFIVQKQDGGYLYATSDLATLYQRIYQLKADKIIYVVDARQTLHFKLLFAVAKQVGFTNSKITLQHVQFGVMCNQKGQPFKTREGNTVKLINLIKEAEQRSMMMLLNQQHGQALPLSDQKKLAQNLAIASIKYADLAKNRSHDYIFDYEQMLSFNGNTAPYLLYAYTRVNSVLKKTNLNLDPSLNLLDNYQIIISDNITRQLIIHLSKFPDAIIQANQTNMPHFICNYVYKLATIFMKFYEQCPVIIYDEVGQFTELSYSRVKLLTIVAKNIKNSLNLLGINTVDKM